MVQITSGLLASPVKTVLYGVKGIGKTTFASKFPAPLFIDLDNGTKRCAVDRVGNIATWEDFMETIKEIAYMDGSPYSTIVIDTVDRAAELCEEYVCRRAKKDTIEDFGFGRGYPALAQEFSKLIGWGNILIDKGYNVVFIGHAMQRVVTRPDDTGSYDHWEMKLKGKGANSLGALLKEWADLLLFADYRITIIQKDDNGRGKASKNSGERRMRTNYTPFADAKNRFGLDDDLPFDYKEISHIPPKREAQKTPPKTDFDKAREKRDEEKTAVGRLRVQMLQGLPMDKEPITEEEFLQAVREVDGDNPIVQHAQAIEQLPDEYIAALLKDDQWQGLRLYVQNHIRVPF